MSIVAATITLFTSALTSACARLGQSIRKSYHTIIRPTAIKLLFVPDRLIHSCSVAINKVRVWYITRITYVPGTRAKMYHIVDKTGSTKKLSSTRHPHYKRLGDFPKVIQIGLSCYPAYRGPVIQRAILHVQSVIRCVIDYVHSAFFPVYETNGTGYHSNLINKPYEAISKKDKHYEHEPHHWSYQFIR